MKAPIEVRVMGLVFLLIGVACLAFILFLPLKILDTFAAFEVQDMANSLKKEIHQLQYMEEWERQIFTVQAKFINDQIEQAHTLRRCPLMWLGYSEKWDDIELIPLPQT